MSVGFNFNMNDYNGRGDSHILRKAKQELAEYIEYKNYANIKIKKPLPRQVNKLPGRNDDCLCGSGIKYKHCCLGSPKPIEVTA